MAIALTNRFDERLAEYLVTCLNAAEYWLVPVTTLDVSEDLFGPSQYTPSEKCPRVGPLGWDAPGPQGDYMFTVSSGIPIENIEAEDELLAGYVLVEGEAGENAEGFEPFGTPQTIIGGGSLTIALKVLLSDKETPTP